MRPILKSELLSTFSQEGRAGRQQMIYKICVYCWPLVRTDDCAGVPAVTHDCASPSWCSQGSECLPRSPLVAWLITRRAADTNRTRPESWPGLLWTCLSGCWHIVCSVKMNIPFHFLSVCCVDSTSFSSLPTLENFGPLYCILDIDILIRAPGIATL